jgi:hypothetical protein
MSMAQRPESGWSPTNAGVLPSKPVCMRLNAPRSVMKAMAPMILKWLAALENGALKAPPSSTLLPAQRQPG